MASTYAAAPAEPPATHPGRSSRAWLAGLAVVFGLASAVRLAYLVLTGWEDTLPDSMADQLYYVDLARNLLVGRGFALSGPVFIASGGPTNLQSPLYPSLLYLSFLPFGMHYLPMRLLQVVLGAATAVLCAQIGARVANRATGLVAGLGLALYPLAVQLTRPLMTEVVATFLLCVITLLVLRFVEERRPWLAVAIGLATGLLYLTAYQGLPLAAALLGWAALRLRRLPPALLLKYGLLGALAFGAVSGPWVGRNAVQFQTIALAPTKSAFALWLNTWHRYLSETAPDYPADAIDSHVAAIPGYSALSEVERAAVLKGQALAFIREHPDVFLKYVPSKVLGGYPLLPREELPAPLGWRNSAPALSNDEIVNADVPGLERQIGPRLAVFRSPTSLDDVPSYQTAPERLRVWAFRLWFLLASLALWSEWRRGRLTSPAIGALLAVMLVNVAGMAITRGQERYRFLTDPYLLVLGALWLAPWVRSAAGRVPERLLRSVTSGARNKQPDGEAARLQSSREGIRRMRIGIDVRYLSHGLLGGVHTYVAHFLPELIKLAAHHRIYLYADTKRPLELGDLPAHVTVRYLPWRSPLSSVYNDLFMRRQMARDAIDVAHFPANYGFGPSSARTVITLHDTLNLLPIREILFREILRGHVRDLRTAITTVYLHYLTRLALRRAELVLTVSEYAKREIARQTGFDPARIVPAPHAPTPDLGPVRDEALLREVRWRHGIERPFVLADALKNPAVLVRAWGLLPSELRAGHEIVFFSRRPDPLPIVHEAVAAGVARLLVRPSRRDLIALYSQAEAFVFPSWIEGFGIPLLEAMSCGAPVIASDRGAIPEVVGDAALLSDAEDAATLARHLTLILTNPEVAAALRERGFQRAAQCSWHETASQTLAAYERAAGSEASRPNRLESPARA